MSTNELHLDDLTFARAAKLAQEQSISIEQLVSQAIERYDVPAICESAPRESMIGMFADVPELIDQIVDEAYRDRKNVPFRLKSE